MYGWVDEIYVITVGVGEEDSWFGEKHHKVECMHEHSTVQYIP